MSILIAGAGPAGSHLAYKLAQEGIDVTLVDRLSDPSKNAFSSAAVPISAIEKLSIPNDAISTYWNSWCIVDQDGNRFVWTSPNHIGAILDFGQLRQSLWRKAHEAGANLLSGHSVKNVRSNENFVDIDLLTSNGFLKKEKANLVVDATGFRRSFLGSANSVGVSNKQTFLTGHGAEWIIQSDSESAKEWQNQVTFFLGTQWIKYGYGWIFPMSDNRLKVGVCSLPPPVVKTKASIVEALRTLIEKLNLSHFSVLDKHGGVLCSSIDRSEDYNYGRIIGVGDSISTANLLGGEGIRHAMMSANILSSYLISTDISNFKSSDFVNNYRKSLQKQFGWRWIISNKIARRTWWTLDSEKADTRIKHLLSGLIKNSSAEDLSALLFDYRFERYGLRLLPYLLGWR